MNKKLLLMTTFLTMVGIVSAQNTVAVDDFTLPQNGGSIAVSISLDQADYYNSFEFKMTTPAGFSYPMNSEGLVDCELGGHSGNLVARFDDANRVLIVKFMSTGIEGQSLTLRIPLEGTTNEVGSVHEFSIKEIAFVTKSFNRVYLNDDVTFNVTIGEPADTRTVLDETSTTVPASATNVDVRVKRTIKANEWSTICLPFAMTEEQVKEAFGDDVQLADFTGADSEFDSSDNVVAITANFTDVQAIEANHPYIIKVSAAITEFTVDGVDIEADEDEAYIEYDNGKTGSRRVVYSGFYGTYHAQTTLEEFSLFLNSNKFWYSAGLTKMKAFRAYFYFLDILTEVENGSANVKMFVNMDDDETGIVSPLWDKEEGAAIYNLAGQRVSKNYKGIVIENGKKTKK